MYCEFQEVPRRNNERTFEGIHSIFILPASLKDSPKGYLYDYVPLWTSREYHQPNP